jgi:hypothetical protein
VHRSLSATLADRPISLPIGSLPAGSRCLRRHLCADRRTSSAGFRGGARIRGLPIGLTLARASADADVKNGCPAFRGASAAKRSPRGRPGAAGTTGPRTSSARRSRAALASSARCRSAPDHLEAVTPPWDAGEFVGECLEGFADRVGVAGSLVGGARMVDDRVEAGDRCGRVAM